MKKLHILSVSLVALSLAACALNKPTDDKTICTQMKRQLNYYENTPSSEATWTTNEQRQTFMQQMRDHHCDQY